MSKIPHAKPAPHLVLHRAFDRRTAARLGRHSRRARGVVLVITLILIVILSLLGTFAIRNATQSERSINGIRSAEVAREAAETALRFCEQVAISDNDGKDYTGFGATGMRDKIITAPTIASESDSAAAWRTTASWTANGITVPNDYFKNSASGTASLTNAPLCLIQKIKTTSKPELTGYLITARGFANNAKFTSNAQQSTQGAESWMQSVLTPAS
ncbi:PilX N-terminal domain-containing pilus assembly protein [Xenophilus arseniciresistens]|uniref:PilX N-terminal domain-containing pilus assembly protein n=1 Tax=Xenophilus arseniciresistens TaxID=1283306 RepID=A0AAE3N5E6_9BURK|nr:PilX N-terminal domain-containing pilus assembly protein [Xenophilus arseniciresistens]MDA7415203.1 PilX N-terminal domain-containing pilus assembly protein [Xenophilus arseniciresistens]